MLLTFVLLLFVTLGGMALSYIYEKEGTLMARLAIGHVLGSAVFGTVGFVIALIVGDLTTAGSVAALVIAAAPAVLFRWERFSGALRRELKRAESATQGLNWARVGRASFYIFFVALFIFFFDRAMMIRPDGIWTGAGHNYGDLPAHLGAIYAFTDGGVFPPDNPSFANAKFTYPFLVDFMVSMFMNLGAEIQGVFLVQNVLLAVSLLVILEKFVAKVTGNATAGKLACFIFFFGGGLGFAAFLNDSMVSGKDPLSLLFNLEKDYTITKTLRWGNPLVVLFITQRSFLLGMPLAILALSKAWEILRAEGKTEQDTGWRSRWTGAALGAGLLTGTLPLIHVHSLAAVFVVCAVLFFFGLRLRWRQWLAFAGGVSVIAVPELIWIMSGSASKFSEFVGFQKGWEHSDGSSVLFWIRNTGLLIPVTLAGVAVALGLMRNAAWASRLAPAEDGKGLLQQPRDLLIFFIPFVLILLICNYVMLAPWSWDNIKVLIYWFVGSLPFMASALILAWRHSPPMKVIAVSVFLVLTSAGAIDVWRVASKQIQMQVFDKGAVEIAAEIRDRTRKDALFLNAPTHNSPIVLTGRRSYLRYPGHLFSYGIDGSQRERETEAIFSGSLSADSLLEKAGVNYVIVGPQERSLKRFNVRYFSKFPVVVERGGHIVYRIK